MKAQELMTKPVITCRGSDTLNIAAQLMWEHDCGALPVVNDDGKLVGMITDRDICMAAYTQGRGLGDCLVLTAMAGHIVSAKADDPVVEVEERMAAHQIRRIPIVDEHNRPIGLVSLNDLAIEASQPDSRMKHGLAKIAHTLAAICRPRPASRRAA